jgi:MoxR-like ATPase
MVPFQETITTKEELVEAAKKGFEDYQKRLITKNDFCMFFGFVHGEAIERFYKNNYEQLLVDGGFNTGSSAYFSGGINAWKNLRDGIYVFPPYHKPEETLLSPNTVSRQIVFYGAPGTGKSNTIKREVDDRNKINFRVTFHPDSDYATFVGCHKPTTVKTGERSAQPILDYDSLVDKFKEYLTVPNVNITKACTLFGFDYHDSIIRIQENGHKVMDLVNDAYKSNTSYDSVVRGGMACYEQNPNRGNGSKITYEFVPQAFTKAYTAAWNTEEDVYLIIEEINRGNCAQIFGDLFQLLDRKNGVSEYPIDADADLANYLSKKLASSTHKDITDEIREGKKLKLPSNLYIWATMNTSDQSLFPIDSAFKRRWDWTYMKIKNHPEENYKIKLSDTEYDWWEFIQRINEIIASMTSSADKQLGYFFCKAAGDGTISPETFVSKVIFYLWNDVFKDYGFEDASLFRYKNDKDEMKDLTFPDFYNEAGEKVNETRLKDFLDKVQNWKKDKEEQNN